MVKEIERTGIPVVHMCNLVPVSKTVGANRIVPTISIPYPLAETGVLSTEVLTEVAAVPEIGLFVVMQQYPLATILCIVALVLLCTFFITSANSGTFVLSMLTSDGALDPPNNKKVLWGVVQSIMAVGLLIAGGLKPLQIISIAAAFSLMDVKTEESCLTFPGQAKNLRHN